MSTTTQTPTLHTFHTGADEYVYMVRRVDITGKRTLVQGTVLRVVRHGGELDCYRATGSATAERFDRASDMAKIAVACAPVNLLAHISEGDEDPETTKLRERVEIAVLQDQCVRCADLDRDCAVFLLALRDQGLLPDAAIHCILQRCEASPEPMPARELRGLISAWLKGPHT